MKNQDNAYDVHTCPGEKTLERSETTNQTKTKINMAKGRKT